MVKDDKDEDVADEEGGEDDFDEFEEEDEGGGIFDEDLDALGDDVEVAISDFDIGSTILGAGVPVQSWSGQNLEETLSREHIEKDWGDKNEFEDGSVYHSSNNSNAVYGASGSDVYGVSGSNVYGGASVGESYGVKKDGASSYSSPQVDIGKLKSHERFMDERRGHNSILESMGFEDAEKKRHDRFASDSIALNEE